MFIWPHGLAVDHDGNVWVTEAVASNRIPKGDKRGHTVVKFSPTGKVLLTLGTAARAGSGPDHFTSPSDVVVSPAGDVFVADGHGATGNNRIMRFSKDGAFVKAWGKTRVRARRVPRRALDCHGFARPAVCRRSRQQSHPDLRSGRQAVPTRGRSSAAQRPLLRHEGFRFTRSILSPTTSKSRVEEGIRIGDAKSGWI